MRSSTIVAFVTFCLALGLGCGEEDEAPSDNPPSNPCDPNPCFEGVACQADDSAPHGYVCGSCPEGMEGDGITCVDIDGCADSPCFPGVECTDVPAPGEGFVCGECPLGTEGDGIVCTACPAGTTGCGCPEGSFWDGTGCRDCFASMIERSWEQRTPMLTPRLYPGVGTSPEGLIYVFGGSSGDSSWSRDLDRYDPATDTWTRLAPLPEEVREMVGVWAGGKLYAISVWTSDSGPGNSYVYDPEQNTWSAMAPFVRKAANPSWAVVGDRIFVIGGVDWVHLDTIYIFDTQTQTWSQGASGAPIGELKAATAFGDKVYVFANGNVPHIYDPATDSWSTARSIVLGSNARAAVTVDDLIYLIGGQDYREGFVDVYSPLCDAWRRGPSMPTPRSGLGATVVDGRIYTFGGFSFLRGSTTFHAAVEAL